VTTETRPDAFDPAAAEAEAVAAQQERLQSMLADLRVRSEELRVERLRTGRTSERI
jgi:hypothetical protein